MARPPKSPSPFHRFNSSPDSVADPKEQPLGGLSGPLSRPWLAVHAEHNAFSLRPAVGAVLNDVAAPAGRRRLQPKPGSRSSQMKRSFSAGRPLYRCLRQPHRSTLSARR